LEIFLHIGGEPLLINPPDLGLGGGVAFEFPHWQLDHALVDVDF